MKKTSKKLSLSDAFIFWLQKTDKPFYKLYTEKFMEFMGFLIDNNGSIEANSSNKENGGFEND